MAVNRMGDIPPGFDMDNLMKTVGEIDFSELDFGKIQKGLEIFGLKEDIIICQQEIVIRILMKIPTKELWVRIGEIENKIKFLKGA